MKTFRQFRLVQRKQSHILSAVQSDNMFYLGLFSGVILIYCFKTASQMQKEIRLVRALGEQNSYSFLHQTSVWQWKHTCCLPANDISYKTTQVCLKLHSMHASGTDVQCFVCCEGLLTHLKCQGHVITVLVSLILVCFTISSFITDEKSGKKWP